MSLADRLHHVPIVLEVVPPHKRAGDATVRKFVTRVRDAVRSLPHLDAINLPEILDENHAGMPWYRNMDPRRCARLLNHELGVEPIVNKVVVHVEGADAFAEWLRESIREYALKNFVFVGGGSSRVRYPGPTVPEANRHARKSVRGDATLGNIAIPERKGEVERMIAKTVSGCRFFTTQVLFEPEPITSILLQYGEACAYEGVPPATVLLSFAPVADYEDIEFLAWLGATIRPETEARLLPRGQEAGTASIEVARSIWSAVRGAVAASRHVVPLGVNIEEISTHNFGLAVKMATEFPSWQEAGG